MGCYYHAGLALRGAVRYESEAEIERVRAEIQEAVTRIKPGLQVYTDYVRERCDRVEVK